MGREGDSIRILIDADGKAEISPKHSLEIFFETEVELEQFAKHLNNLKKYRWHDLRKNPDDLPTHTNIVEVELWGEVLGIYHDHTWFKDGNWKHYANNSYGKVIGWREIEPMEGETE